MAEGTVKWFNNSKALDLLKKTEVAMFLYIILQFRLRALSH